MSKISVIIPTCRRVELLTRCLHSLHQQTIPPSEIVVVDNDEGRSAHPIVRHFHTNITISYCHERRKGVSFARNAGIKHAKHTIIGFLDDDCEADTKWVEYGLALMTTHPKSVIAGVGINNKNPNIYARVEQNMTMEMFSRLGVGANAGVAISAVDTKSFMFDKTLLSRANIQFDTHYRAIFEDLDFAQLLHIRAIPIVSEPRMVVSHTGRGSFMKLLKREWIKGQDFFYFTNKWSKESSEVAKIAQKHPAINRYVQKKKRELENSYYHSRSTTMSSYRNVDKLKVVWIEWCMRFVTQLGYYYTKFFV